jgi:glycosyltransferase involved in cell wall biosynthesis
MVGTNVSVEGMNVQAGEHILIADTPEEFAQSMIRLNADDAAWNVLSEAGPESVRAQFSADTARQQLQNILSEIVES